MQDTLVGGWWFDIFYGSSNVTVSDSKLYGLGADQFAFISFYGSTISSKLRIYGSSELYLYETKTQELDCMHVTFVWLPTQMHARAIVFPLRKEIFLFFYDKFRNQ